MSPQHRRAFLDLGFAADNPVLYGMEQPHQHGEVEVNFLTAGAVGYLLGDQVIRLPIGALAIFWAARPHRIIHHHDVQRFYWLTIPLPWFLSWSLPADLVRSVMGGQLVVDRAPLAFDEVLLEQWKCDLSHARTSATELVKMEVQARITRMGLAFVSHTSTDRVIKVQADVALMCNREAAIRHVVRIAALIGAHFSEPLTVVDIADATGLHPNYATMLFRKYVGSGIQGYLTQQRLYHAQHLLAQTKLPIDQVALRSGFGSLSRFYDVFKCRIGMTPRRYRNHIATDGDESSE